MRRVYETRYVVSFRYSGRNIFLFKIQFFFQVEIYIRFCSREYKKTNNDLIRSERHPTAIPSHRGQTDAAVAEPMRNGPGGALLTLNFGIN